MHLIDSWSSPLLSVFLKENSKIVYWNHMIWLRLICMLFLPSYFLPCVLLLKIFNDLIAVNSLPSLLYHPAALGGGALSVSLAFVWKHVCMYVLYVCMCFMYILYLLWFVCMYCEYNFLVLYILFVNNLPIQIVYYLMKLLIVYIIRIKYHYLCN